MRYANINFNDTVNGEGLRVTLWCQGCTRRCEDCHNKHLWNFNKGKLFTKEESNKIINYIKKYDDFIQGLSLLGGEPMDNAKDLIKFVQHFKKELPQKNIWIWSGYTFEEIIKNEDMFNLLKLCDVLVDGKYDNKLRNLKLRFRGSENQRVIDISRTLSSKQIVNLDI